MNEVNIVIENNQVLVTSKEVARDFNKEHKHVLRDIDSFKKDVSNFGLMFQTPFNSVMNLGTTFERVSFSILLSLFKRRVQLM
jgi:phage regulator Rha-like protein